MSVTKCMIAGLPGSGKSTYIGALWYCLMHPEKVGNIKLVADKMNLADDLTALNRLSEAYKNMKLIDRNYSNQNETVLINLKEAGSDKKYKWKYLISLEKTFAILLFLKNQNLFLNG